MDIMDEYSWEFLITSLALILIVRKSSIVTYYLKFAYYVGVMNIFHALFIPIFVIRPKNVSNFLVQSAVLRHISKIIGVNWTLRGAENLISDKSFIIVANHQDGLDVLGMMEIWPVVKNMTAIAKRELLYTGPFGISLLLSGITFIDRKAGGKAGEAMNNKMEDLKSKQIKLWIFPEGTRRNTGAIHQFKKGAFHTAIHAQVPIVPIVFSSYKLFLDKDEKVFNNGEVIITALPKIPTAGLTAENVDELLTKTRNLMIETYKRTTKEVHEMREEPNED